MQEQKLLNLRQEAEAAQSAALAARNAQGELESLGQRVEQERARLEKTSMEVETLRAAASVVSSRWDPYDACDISHSDHCCIQLFCFFPPWL